MNDEDQVGTERGPSIPAAGSALAPINIDIAESPFRERSPCEARDRGGAVVKIRRRGTRADASSSDSRKIITQIKTARNVARRALDHLSHNFCPKSPAERTNRPRPRREVPGVHFAEPRGATRRLPPRPKRDGEIPARFLLSGTSASRHLSEAVDC